MVDSISQNVGIPNRRQETDDDREVYGMAQQITSSKRNPLSLLLAGHPSFPYATSPTQGLPCFPANIETRSKYSFALFPRPLRCVINPPRKAKRPLKMRRSNGRTLVNANRLGMPMRKRPILFFSRDQMPASSDAICFATPLVALVPTKCTIYQPA